MWTIHGFVVIVEEKLIFKMTEKSRAFPIARVFSLVPMTYTHDLEYLDKCSEQDHLRRSR